MNPRAEDVLKVIRNLETVLPYAKEDHQLDMEEIDVTCEEGENLCGTVHCHGGWYAVAVKEWQKEPKSTFISYTLGAGKMARDLGFEWMTDLEHWAEEHPRLWGNIHGAGVFSNPMAFQSPTRPNGARNVRDIVEHWKEVHARILALERPEHEDITSELAVLPPDETADIVDVKTVEHAN
jgi:hypothetical protein